MKLERTARYQAESLLGIHEGRCSVKADSPIAETFRSMEREELVVITRDVDPKSTMLNITRKELFHHACQP